MAVADAAEKTLNMSNKNKVSPWAWIPSLYFAEGLPNVAVMTISVILYKRLGISNADIALYTSLLYLPWVIKPFWSPFVDIVKTKRWWIVTMQIIISLCLVGVALSLPTSSFFKLSLAFFWVMGFVSATHDIAADGFYMLALDTHKQSLYVGIRSTFYRVAVLFGQGILVVIAGVLEISTGKEPANIVVQASPEIAAVVNIPQSGDNASFRLAGVDEEGWFIITPDTLKVSTQKLDGESVATLKNLVMTHNSTNGFIPALEEGYSAKAEELAVAVVSVRLNQAPAVGDTVVLNTAFKDGDKSISIVAGERLEFTSSNWDKDALVAIQLDSKLNDASMAEFQGLSGNIPLAWSITFMIMAVFFFVACIYHRFILPRPVVDKPKADASAKSIFNEFVKTFITFFKKKHIWIGIAFMLLYRLPEAQLVKLITPFLLDAKEAGGMGLTTGQVGIVYGTVGILGLTLGGIIGGIAAAKGGLKKWLWPMAASITLPSLVYVYLAYFQGSSLLLINISIFIEQFGYGFGFTAYMLYMIFISEGEYKTAHYAICTGFMALGLMIPGIVAGWIQEQLGYINFFWFVMLCCLITVIVTLFVKVDPEFGKKKALPEAVGSE